MLTVQGESSEPLSKLLRQLGQDAHCYDDETCTCEIHPSTPLKYALLHGRVLVINSHRQYILKAYGSGRGTMSFYQHNR